MRGVGIHPGKSSIIKKYLKYIVPPGHCPFIPASMACGLDSRQSFWKDVGGGGKITVLTSAAATTHVWPVRSSPTLSLSTMAQAVLGAYRATHIPQIMQPVRMSLANKAIPFIK